MTELEKSALITLYAEGGKARVGIITEVTACDGFHIVQVIPDPGEGI